MAIAREIACLDELSGLLLTPATDITRDTAEHLLRDLRLTPLLPIYRNWRRLWIIEELEYLPDGARRFLKFALEPANLPSRTIVLATSNDTSALEQAFLDRFQHIPFDAGTTFRQACLHSLQTIWKDNTPSPTPPLPHAWQHCGLAPNSQDWSHRRALRWLQQRHERPDLCPIF